MTDLVKRLRIKAGMIELGELIAWGSDSALMREAADVLEGVAAPAVQGEPVGEVRLELGAPSVVYGKLYSEAAPTLVPGALLYTAPQPAPNVAGLVEALERLVGDVERATHVEFGGTPWLKEKMTEIDYARAALAAHRKQGGEK